MTTHKMTTPRRTKLTSGSRLLLVAWIVLLGLTAGSYWVSDLSQDSATATAFAVLGLATLKAHLIAGLFMEMVHAPRIWAIVMSAFLLMLGGSLVALFL